MIIVLAQTAYDGSRALDALIIAISIIVLCLAIAVIEALRTRR